MKFCDEGDRPSVPFLETLKLGKNSHRRLSVEATVVAGSKHHYRAPEPFKILVGLRQLHESAS